MYLDTVSHYAGEMWVDLHKATLHGQKYVDTWSAP